MILDHQSTSPPISLVAPTFHIFLAVNSMVAHSVVVAALGADDRSYLRHVCCCLWYGARLPSLNNLASDSWAWRFHLCYLASAELCLPILLVADASFFSFLVCRQRLHLGFF